MAKKSETVLFPVTQSILPWTFNFNLGAAATYAPMTVALGDSGDPGLERKLLTVAGSYGRQIGRIGDALAVVIDQLVASGALDVAADSPEAAAIADLRAQLKVVAAMKALNSGT